MDDLEKVVLVAILAVVAGVVMYFEWRFMRNRGIGRKIAESATKKDRAFNALLTTKAIRNKLRTQNYDTLKADYIIQKAQDANESGDYDSCIESCTRAREELMRCKQGGRMAVGTYGADDGAFGAAPDSNSGANRERKLKMPPRPKEDPSLPARFELRTAKDDLEAFTGDAETRTSAAALISQAEKHLEAKEYDKALSCAFKAKKLLSGEPIKQERAEPYERISPAPSKPQEISQPAAQAEMPRLECPSCGSPAEQGDAFCGQCGTPIGDRECASCGAKLKPTDKFCRKCGTKI